MPYRYYPVGKKGVMILPGSKNDFDKAATTWDDEPRRVKLAGDVARTVIREVGLSPDMNVLDYGCGTGLVTLQLQPYVGSVTGADTSRGMLEVLRRKIRESGLANVSAVLIDTDKEIPVEGKFNLVVSSMTMHHIQDVETLFRKFHNLLLPGGRLCVADLDAEDGSFHSNTTGVAHFGFDRREVRSMLGNAGFEDIREVTASVIVKDSDSEAQRAYPVFLMTARK